VLNTFYPEASTLASSFRTAHLGPIGLAEDASLGRRLDLVAEGQVEVEQRKGALGKVAVLTQGQLHRHALGPREGIIACDKRT
jgi:hypothetical protein